MDVASRDGRQFSNLSLHVEGGLHGFGTLHVGLKHVVEVLPAARIADRDLIGILRIGRPADAACLQLRAVPALAHRGEGARHRVLEQRHEVARGEHADATANDGRARAIDGPGKSGARGEVHLVVVNRLVQRARRAEIHLANVGRIAQIVDLRRVVWIQGLVAKPGIVVVAETQVEHEPIADAPVVLEEAAELVDPRAMGRIAHREQEVVRLVRQKVVEVGEGKPVRLRIRLEANLACPAEPELHRVGSHEAGHLLVQVVRVVRQREDFGIPGIEEA